MKRLLILLALLCAFTACCNKQQSKRDYIVAAYIWPSCHDDAIARE